MITSPKSTLTTQKVICHPLISILPYFLLKKKQHGGLSAVVYAVANTVSYAVAYE